MAYGTATLTGKYETFDGQPASGVVEIIPNSRQLVDPEGDVILSGRVKVTLDETGAFSVTLPATDDATVEPATGRQYTVVAKLRHTHLAAVTGIELATGATVDVADLASAPVVDPLVSTAATTAQLDALEASLSPVATSGAYSDLTGAPTIPATAADVGAEPAGTTAALDASLAPVAKSGAYTDLTGKPTIPTTAADVNALPDTTTAADIGAQPAATLDADTAARVNDTASQTRAALSATFASVDPNTGEVLDGNGNPVTGGGAAQIDLVSDLVAPVYIAHRASQQVYVEHSMEGQHASAAAGFVLDSDAQPLADGTLVSFHNGSVDGYMLNADGSPATGNVNTFTRAQWQSMRLKPLTVTGQAQGTPVLWEDMLTIWGGRYLIMAETWTSGPAANMIALLDKYGLKRAVICQSFTRTVAQQFAAAGCAALFLDGANQTDPASLAADGIEFVGISTAPPNSYITACNAAGVKVFVYTINDKVTADAKIAAGALGVFTDDPWAIAKRGPYQMLRRFNDAQLWPGYRSRIVTTSGPGHQISLVPDGLKLYLPGSGYVETRHGWMGEMPSTVRVTVTAEYQADAVTQDRAFSVSLLQRSDNDPFYDGAVAGQGGYRLFARRDGRLQVYKIATGGAPTSIAINTATSAFAAAGAKAEITVTLEINATNVKATTTSGGGITHDIADTTFRGPTYLHLGANGLSVIFKQAYVEYL